MGQRTKTSIRIVGLLAGLAAALAYVASGRVQAGAPTPGATVTVVAGSANELSVTPAGTVLSARDLLPGGAPARGQATLWNPTDVTLSVTPRVVSSSPDLDRAVKISIRSAGSDLFEGTLGDARAAARSGPVLIRAGKRRPLELAARLPASVRTGWEAREVEARLELITKVVQR